MANNLIKLNQLDPAISGYIAGILGLNFASFAALFGSSSGDLGDHVLYVTGGAQTIYGNKTFALSPNVPYSGASGQAISKLFVTDSLAVLQAQINTILPNYVSQTGNQTISGVKSYAYLIQASGGIFSNECLVPFPTNGSGAVSLDFLTSVGAVTCSGDQTISGNKTFATSISVPLATLSAHATQLSQLLGTSGALSTQIATSGGSLDSRLSVLEHGGVSGFAGVLSINGASGRAYIRGAGGVTVYQDGSITRISGNVNFDSTKTYLVRTPIPTGVSSYPISFSGASFSGAPIVIGSLINSTGQGIYAYGISGITSSGCSVYFSSPITASGYEFHCFAGPSGMNILAEKGAQGDAGINMTYRGVWQNGITYAPLDYVLLSGASFFCAQTHISAPAQNPFIAPTYWNVALSGNGAVGPIGPSGGKGDKGDKGDGGILFRWRGEWTPITPYLSGDAVYFSGSAYGMTGLYTASGNSQNPFTDASGRWSLVINGSGIDTSSFYPRSNPSGFITGFNSGLFIKASDSGLFALSGHAHPGYVTGLQIDGRIFSGLVNIFGTGGITVTSLGNSIMISGNFSGVGGGISVQGGGFRWRGDWSPDATYVSGDAVEKNHAGYLFTGSGSLAGLNTNPLSITSQWTNFEERELTFHNGDFDPNKIYYKNDLAHISDSLTQASVLYVNTSDIPQLSLNPFTQKYNSFVDCDGLTGYNLFTVKDASKLTSHPYYNLGSANTFLINDRAPNQNASGHGTLTLIRGQTYIFDSEIFDGFILTTDSSGGWFSGQYTGNCKIGSRLEADGINATAMGPFDTLNSGTLYFSPDNTTPNDLWFQSAFNTYMGWKIKVVDSSPWKVFVSGAIGQKGDKGDQGNPGLAFVWKGDWNSTGIYNAYDSVYFEGSSWGTLQTVLGEPPSEISAAWRVLAKGGQSGVSGGKGDPGLAFVWRGNWDTNYIYHSGDSVFFSGASFATQTTNSGKNPIQFNVTWFPVAGSGARGVKGEAGLAFAFLGDWSSSKTYHSGESVFYDGSSWGTYQDVTATPPPVSPWMCIAQRGGTIFSWRGSWNSGTQYYANDAVYFSGSSYGTTSRASGTLPSDGGSWFLTTLKGGDGATGPSGSQGLKGDGFHWNSTWASTGVYTSGSVVRYNGSAYLCLSGNSGILPTFYPTWELMVQKGDTPLFNYQGVWDSGISYAALDMVFWDGSTWATQVPIISGLIPGEAPSWKNVAFGFSNNVVRTSGSQTISGAKVFAGPIVNRVAYNSAYLVTVDSGNMYGLAISSNNFTIIFSDNLIDGQSIRVMTDVYGAYSGIWAGTIKWAGGSAPTFTTGTSSVPGTDMFEFWQVSGRMFGRAVQHFF